MQLLMKFQDRIVCYIDGKTHLEHHAFEWALEGVESK